MDSLNNIVNNFDRFVFLEYPNRYSKWVVHLGTQHFQLILTYLSKTFDCICYDLLIAKLNAYGFDKKALKLIYDYHNGSSQKVKVGFRSLEH